jgi:IS605 OrfB family transposase
MDTVRTIICKLAPTAEQCLDVDATLDAFASACNRIAEIARAIGSTNKVKVQAVCYREIRETFGLSANLAIRAIARVCAALKVPEKADSGFAPTSVDYDARIFSFRERDWTFSLTLLSGRVKLASVLGERQRAMLKGRTPTSATLVKRRDGGDFLHVQIVDEAPKPIATTGTLGIDLGVVNLATDSDGETFRGDQVEACRRHYGQRRKILQSIGTKSAKRKLRKTTSKESRFRKDKNHKISKAIVAKAKGTARAIGVEDLAGIGERTTVNQVQRSRVKGWAFYQLRTFIAYKALAEGVPVIPIDPRNTSRTCSSCGHCEKRNRKNRNEFKCRHCGLILCADVNAARNIRDWAEVMRPMAGVVDAGGRSPAETHLQAHVL